MRIELMDYKYIGILDFEANCEENTKLDVQEIIEFPVVFYNLEKQCIEQDKTFHHYCQVVKYPITEFCTQLTGITQEIVDNGKPFVEVLQLFGKWVRDNQLNINTLFLTCGDWDFAKCLKKYCNHLNIPYPGFFKRWCNIKTLFKEFYHQRSRGMMYMLNALDIPHEGRHHSGIDDCLNIAKIVDRMVKDGCEFVATSRV